MKLVITMPNGQETAYTCTENQWDGIAQAMMHSERSDHCWIGLHGFHTKLNYLIDINKAFRVRFTSDDDEIPFSGDEE